MTTAKQIKILLLEKDLSMGELAEKTEYTRTHISNVVNGRHDSRRARKAIASGLKVPLESLWANEGAKTCGVTSNSNMNG